jgi:hypothetical protein
MAADKKSKASLQRMTPNSIDVPVDGSIVRVACDKKENAILNMIMASQIRHLLQEQIKKYKDADQTLTPKELNDLTAAARNIATFSGEVYGGQESIEPPGEKKVEKDDEEDFGVLGKPIEIEVKNGDGNEAQPNSK